MVEMTFLLGQVINGLVHGMILFLVASGLSITFGIQGLINFAHGAFYMLGAVVAVLVAAYVSNFFLVLVIAAVAVGFLGVIFERLLLSHLYDRDPIYQLLLTFGASLVIVNGTRLIVGSAPKRLSSPEILSGFVEFGPIFVTQYRLFVFGLGFVIAVVTYLFLEKTKTGTVVQASARDPEMLRILGYDTWKIVVGIFFFGTVLAAVGGIAVAPMQSVRPEMGIEILLVAFIIVIVGGMGTFAGAFYAALLIGVIMSVTTIWWSAGSQIMAFVVLIAVLLFKPEGFFGEEGVLE